MTLGRRFARARPPAHFKERVMPLTSAHILPLAALVAGILVLIWPRILNYIVAIFLIVYGVVHLNSIHHFIH
jgi:Protein of unknown function (DUF3096)